MVLPVVTAVTPCGGSDASQSPFFDEIHTHTGCSMPQATLVFKRLPTQLDTLKWVLGIIL